MTAALSPSRAADFKQCPLKYRFRAIDGLDEPPSPAAARGTLVHAVLEELFELPAPERTPRPWPRPCPWSACSTRTASASTRRPAVAHSGVMLSASLWLIPPWQGVKTITEGTRRAT